MVQVVLNSVLLLHNGEPIPCAGVSSPKGLLDKELPVPADESVLCWITQLSMARFAGVLARCGGDETCRARPRLHLIRFHEWLASNAGSQPQGLRWRNSRVTFIAVSPHLLRHVMIWCLLKHSGGINNGDNKKLKTGA